MIQIENSYLPYSNPYAILTASETDQAKHKTNRQT